jgi:hypothetical protein
MVKVYAEHGSFRVEGTFDFGYAGIYRNEQISIRTGDEDIRTWTCVQNALNTETCTDQDIAGFLTYHINAIEKRVQENRKAFNDDFLLDVFLDMCEPAIAFWEHEELTVQQFMPYAGADELYDLIYAPADKAIQAYFKRFRESQKEGRVETVDMEALLRQNMPMFNWDYFPGGIVPEHLTFQDGSTSFQCSDSSGGVILCHAYCEFDEDLKGIDWHNF